MPRIGLCADCRHARVIRNRRGSEFHLCRRSRSDPAYPRYPRLPVLDCPGYEPDAANSAGGGTSDGRSGTTD